MKAHVVIAAFGFAAFVWICLLTAASRATASTRSESTLLAWRRHIATRMGLGGMERLAQHPTSLDLQSRMLGALALLAFGFSCWHLASAILSN